MGVYFVLWSGLGYGIHYREVLGIGELGRLGLACLAWLVLFGLACFVLAYGPMGPGPAAGQGLGQWGTASIGSETCKDKDIKTIPTHKSEHERSYNDR